MEQQSEELPILHLFPVLYRIIGLTESHKKFGITKTQVMIFIALYYKKSMTMSEVAQYISSSKEQATRTVAVLCDNGLVERYENPENRTHVFIRLTQTGEERLKELFTRLRQDVADKLKSSLDEEDILRLNEAVKTAVEILGKVR